MLFVKSLVIHFTIGQKITVNNNVVADFPNDSYWEIAGRDLIKKTVILQNVQWGQKINLSFECFAFLLSDFKSENFYLIPKRKVPKVIHLKTP